MKKKEIMEQIQQNVGNLIGEKVYEVHYKMCLLLHKLESLH